MKINTMNSQICNDLNKTVEANKRSVSFRLRNIGIVAKKDY